MAAFGKTGPFWTGTLANLKLIGTDDGLVVGDPAFDTTNGRLIVCQTAAGGSSTWAYKQDVLVAWECTPTGTGKIYVAFFDLTESSAETASRISLTLPYAGQIKAATVTQNSGGVMGNTNLTTHFGTGGAHVSGTATETEVANVIALDDSEVVTYNSSSFAAGDRFALGLQATVDPSGGDVAGTILIELTIPV